MFTVLFELLSRSTPCTPRICRRCNRITTRLRPAQRAQALAGEGSTCKRRGCGGRLDLIASEARR